MGRPPARLMRAGETAPKAGPEPAPVGLNAARPIVVAKFGGSSLATPEHIRAIADRIVADRSDGADRVVVVSAMGDTTDDLLDLACRVSRRPDPRQRPRRPVVRRL